MRRCTNRWPRGWKSVPKLEYLAMGAPVIVSATRQVLLAKARRWLAPSAAGVAKAAPDDRSFRDQQ